MSSDVTTPSFGLVWPTRDQAEAAVEVESQGRLERVAELSYHPERGANRVIEGDNLDVLRLLADTEPGSVDVIVTDPPYNTGGAFVYRDRFAQPLTEYLDLAGTRKSDRSAMAGRLHDAWLTFMYPRLAYCHRLLADHGVFAISIDDNEMANLRLLLDEIFGPACFKNAVVTRRGTKNVQAQFATSARMAVGHEYLLVYTKDPDTRLRKLEVPKPTPARSSWNNHWRGTNRPTMRYELLGHTPTHGQWRWAEARSLRALENYQRLLDDVGVAAPSTEQVDAWYLANCGTDRLDLLRANPRTGKPEHYVAASATQLGSDLWTDLPPTGTSELKKLFGARVFDAPKPTALIQRLLDVVVVSEGDTTQVVLDPFAGSGTVGAAVATYPHEEAVRSFWLVQAAEPIDERTGSQAVALGMRTVADVARERVKRVLDGAEDPTGFEYLRYVES